MKKSLSKNYLSGMLSLILLSGCAGIKHKYAEPARGNSKLSPTAQIRNFTNETHQRELDQVISSEQAPIGKREFFLTQKNSKLEKKWTKYFTTNGKRGFRTFLNNGEKYKTIIEAIFKKHNLPKELFYVGLIESGYKTKARSHASAVGPWQFVKGTAKRYGLKVTRSIDERQNIYKSTQAAALYFQDLYNIFGSWELALSAYNAGEFGVIRRIRKARTRDFYELSRLKVLPKETRNYVPKIIAAMKVDTNKTKYGIFPKKIANNPFNHIITHKIKGSISLNKLAKQLKISKRTIIALNQDIKGQFIPYLGRAGFEIILPKNKDYDFRSLDKRINKAPRKNRYISKSKASSKSLISKSYHRVRKNESLFSISKRYNVTLKTLRKLNKLTKSRIYPGQKIKLPYTGNTKIKYSYIVKKGDHLTKIAGLFKTRTKKIIALNGLKRTSIFVGQKLKVPAHKKNTHIVKPGDILLKIAKNYKVSVAQIKKLNGFNHSRIYVGQKIIINLVRI
jgi:membrane-bound lytic murein transglycosylase D